MNYEWDTAKNTLNRRKHGVDFAMAIAALEDPDRLEDIDTDHDEERLRVIGMVDGTVLFVVAAARSEDVCRIVSARRATRHEQDRYYAGDREIW